MCTNVHIYTYNALVDTLSSSGDWCLEKIGMSLAHNHQENIFTEEHKKTYSFML